MGGEGGVERGGFYKYPYNIPKEYGIIEEIVLRGRLYGHFCLYKIFMWDTDKMCYVDAPLRRIVRNK